MSTNYIKAIFNTNDLGDGTKKNQLAQKL